MEYMFYEPPKKPVQLLGIFALYSNEFQLLLEMIPCQTEALRTLQILACNFSAKTFFLCSSGTGGFPDSKMVYLEVFTRNRVIHEKPMIKNGIG